MSRGEADPIIEARARAAASKSEGMRILFDAGYSVADAARVIGVDYAFAYGVAKRAGQAETAAKRRPTRESVPGPQRLPPDSSGRDDGLEAEYRRIALDHRATILKMTARSALPPSVTRVFQAGTKDALVELLGTLPVDELAGIEGDAGFRVWHERQLDVVAACVLRLNPPRLRPGIHPGYHWGHAAKVLALYVRDVVLFSRYFSDDQVERVGSLLCCPVDGIVLKRLRLVGVRPGVSLINEIDTRAKFWALQDRFQLAAAAVGVPRVWFDDVWGDRAP